MPELVVAIVSVMMLFILIDDLQKARIQHTNEEVKEDG